MKTRNLIPAILIVLIHAMMNAQKPSETKRILPALGKVKTVQHLSASERILHDLKESKTNPVIVHEEKSETAAEKTDNNTFNYYNNANCYASLTWCNELNSQAEKLEKHELELRDAAKLMPALKRKEILKMANDLIRQAQVIRIQASEISGRLSLQKFKDNHKLFVSLCEETQAGQTVIRAAYEANNYAARQMKIAKEMREEAYAMPSNGAKLGSMNNAEEKEFIALKKQGEAIAVLKQYVTSLSKAANGIAVK